MVTILFSLAWLTNLDPAWIALVGTLFGGIGLKALEHFLNKPNVKKAEAKDARSELGEMLKNLQDRQDSLQAHVDRLEAEVTDWRNRFYSEQEKRHLLRLQLLEAKMTPADAIDIALSKETPP